MKPTTNVTLRMLLALAAATTATRAAPDAQNLLEAAGIRGGVIVHVGCGSGEFTADLHATEACIVHGLDTDPNAIDRARRHIRSRGLDGRVSVATFDGKHLPYVDNLVNAVVIRDAKCEIRAEEIQRVLAPRGVVLAPRGTSRIPQPASPIGAEQILHRKPVPPEIDDWTHFLHGPDNNALAVDTRVGPPRGMQWIAGPLWTRHHHHDKGTAPTVRAIVSAKGRIFYVVDEATAANIAVPHRWFLAARDAFNGALLWKQPLQSEKFARRLEQVWRTLVTDGNHLYASLGTGLPLSALDAATGTSIREYAGTESAVELVNDAGRLFAVTAKHCVVAFDTATGKPLWRWQASDGVAVVPLTLAAAGDKVCWRTDDSVRCVAAETGKRLWEFTPPGEGKRKRLKFPREVLVLGKGIALVSYGGNAPLLMKDKWDYLGSHPPVKDYGGTLAALSTEDGRVLWKTAYRPGLESGPGEVYISGNDVLMGPDFSQKLDLRTGAVREKRDLLNLVWTNGHHYRCYPGKATSRYIFTAKRGIEIFDQAGDDHSRNNWVRGTCRVGVLPCNGLIYAPPHSCGCYMEAKLVGFWALAGERPKGQKVAEPERLKKGPAYSEISDSKSLPSHRVREFA